jgi:YD repeat-containing protein
MYFSSKAQITQSPTADVGNDNSIDVTYKWDALGRRVYRDDNTTAEIYFQAGQYSVVASTDGSGTIEECYTYSAYGTPKIMDGSGTARTAPPSGDGRIHQRRKGPCI